MKTSNAQKTDKKSKAPKVDKKNKVAKSDKKSKATAKTDAKQQEFHVFGDTLVVSPARVEYTAMRKEFEVLADEQYEKAKSEIDEAAKDVDEFYKEGTAWAWQYFTAAADLASKIMSQNGCYDVDSDHFAEKYLDISLWEKRFGKFCEAIEEVYAEEDEGSQSRRERWNNAGNWYAKNKYSEQYVKDKNFNENVAAGALNVVSWGFSALMSSSGKRSAFNDNREKLLTSIYATIKTAVDELVDCLADYGISLDGAKVSKADREKAERLFNNMKSGNLPAKAVDDAKMQILRLNPYSSDFYEYVYENDGDKSGELCSVADFFGVSLESLKKDAFSKRLGKCGYKTEEETLEYRKKAVSLAKELRIDATKKLNEIDSKLKKFDEEARTAGGRMFESREEAVKQRELCEFEEEQDISTEDNAVKAKKAVLAKAKSLKIDGEWRLERINAALKKFDLEARTVDKREFKTREEAAKQRTLSEFEASQDLSSEEAALRSKSAILAKISELGIDGEWKLTRVDKALKKFDELARTTFGIMFDTRKEAKAALENRDLFYKGIEATVKATGVESFYISSTMPEKKIANARNSFPIPHDDFVLALTDTTLLGSGKTGLAITHWGLRWENGRSKATNVNAISWEEFANSPTPPEENDNNFTLAHGGLYANGGSRIDAEVMLGVLRKLFDYCKVAAFFSRKTADELASEEAMIPFQEKVVRVLQGITDSGFLFGERLSDKKAAKAAISCMVDMDDKILAVIDSTLLGTAATALVISRKGVYWHNKEDLAKCFIPWHEMASYKSTISIVDGKRLLFSQGYGFKAGISSVNLEKVKDALVKIGEFAAKEAID